MRGFSFISFFGITGYMIEKLTKLFLLLSLVVVPFVKMDSLFYPFTSGKAFFFRFFVLLALLGWAFLMIKNRKFRLKFNILVIAFVLYITALFVTGLFSIDIAHSFFSNFERSDGIFQFIFFFIYFLMMFSVFRTKKDWQFLIFTFLLLGLILSIYSWVNYKEQPRLYAFFGNPSYFGAFLLVAIGFAAVMIKYSFDSISGLLAHKATKAILIVLTLFFSLTLFYTGTRGCYAGLASAFLLFILLTVFFLRRNKKLIIPLVSLAGISLIILVSIFVFADHSFIKNNGILSRITDLREFNSLPSIQERLSVWNIAVKGFKDKPVFGWGPENFGPVFNKYYDYQVGLNEPWFDKAHNQFLEVLATGGIVLFSSYLFLIFSVFYLIFKITKKERILGIISASVYSGYLIQGMFLFDTFAMYLPLFTFLAFISFEYQRNYPKEEEKERVKMAPSLKVLIGIFILIVFSLIYSTAWLPYRANSLALGSYLAIREADFEKSKVLFEESLEYDTPFSFSSVRKMVPWEILPVLFSIREEVTSDQIRPDLKELYKAFVVEMEELRGARPYDPQIYYVLGLIYRLGGEHLYEEDLAKAEEVFEESLNYSTLRADYYNEYAKVLLAEQKYEQAKELVKEYAQKSGRNDPFVFITLGHIGYNQGDYKDAMENYEKAREKGYRFSEIEGEYNRYLLTAQELSDYQKITDMALEYLEKKELVLTKANLAKTYYNVAVGYMSLEKKEEAKEFFYKALELDDSFEKYKSIFDNL